MKARLRRDHGLTLVELLVAMTLLGVVVALATVSFTIGLRTSDDNQARDEATRGISLALDNAAKGLRTAVAPAKDAAAFQVANSDEVEFWAALNTTACEPSLVRYFVDAKATLVEEVTPAEGSARRRILASGVQEPAVFTYLRAPTNTTDPLRVLAAPVRSPDDLKAIRAVDIRLTARARNRPDAPLVTAASTAYLVNADANPTGENSC